MEATTSQPTMNLLSVPVEMLDKIFSYLSYDQIAKLRLVNKMFDTICSNKLNKGFFYLNQFHSRCLKEVKAKLPRRESERRHHPLARHSDILMAVETRLSMLSMTFTKYIEAHKCCFIPGKVLDEALKVLRIVNNCTTPVKSTGQFPMLPRPHDFLQEYRDVSSMAMEHFDEKVLPGIRETMRLDNPRLYCFKNKPDARIVIPAGSVDGPRNTLFRAEYYKLRQIASTSAEPSENAASSKEKESNAEVKALSKSLLMRLYSGMRANKVKCNTVHQSVVKLHQAQKQVTRKTKLEMLTLRKQIAQQRVMMKHLRRELRETRAAMNVMSKDLNQLKIEQSPSIGTKRKRESCDEECGE